MDKPQADEFILLIGILCLLIRWIFIKLGIMMPISKIGLTVLGIGAIAISLLDMIFG